MKLDKPKFFKFNFGQRVKKKGTKGQWHGTIVGFYSATCTEMGYAVESEREEGSVQIYPESALEMVDDTINLIEIELKALQRAVENSKLSTSDLEIFSEIVAKAGIKVNFDD